jgi:hypothetical protein
MESLARIDRLRTSPLHRAAILAAEIRRLLALEVRDTTGSEQRRVMRVLEQVMSGVLASLVRLEQEV